MYVEKFALLRLKAIELSAQNILQDTHIWKPPVPIHEILEKMTVVNSYEDDGERGFCLEKQQERHVYINRTMIPEDLNFILAHQLGHLMLDHLHKDLKSLTEIQVQNIQIEADFFADCLLLPAAWLRAACPESFVTQDFARDLAQLYCVPQYIMNRRLHDLGIRWLPKQ